MRADRWNWLIALVATWVLTCAGCDSATREKGVFEYDLAAEFKRAKVSQEVGEIDLLAKHRKKPRWLVVELKRGRTSDYAVGQALRYRGWVKRHLAEQSDSVEAIVVAHLADPKLLYALEGIDDVSVRTYSVRFSLDVPKGPWEL